jgi:hypothetical protein
LTLDKDWNQICYVAYKSPAARASGQLNIAALIHERPEDVEVWQLNARLVNGRRDGIEYHLHAVAKHGAKRAGGVREAVGAVLGLSPASRATVKWFETASLQPTVEAAALRVLAAATTCLDEAGMQSLVAHLSTIPCPVPMPHFECSTLDFTFLARYTPQRRVTLITDLWRDHIVRQTGNTLRVAQELATRNGHATIRAIATVDHIVASAPETVAAALINDLVWFDDITTLLSPGVLKAIAARPRHRHIVAFQPQNADPSIAIETLRNKRLLERDSLVIPRGPMHPAVAQAVIDELTSSASMHHTHSSTQCQNLLRLAISVAATTPNGAPLLVQAYTNWTRTNASLRDWAQHEISTLFDNIDIVLDKASIERLHKAQLEHARFIAAYTSRKNYNAKTKTSGEGSPGAINHKAPPSVEHQHFSPGLLAMLEAQPEAPRSVKAATESALAAAQWTHRTPSGRLVRWYERFTDHPFTIQELAASLTTAVANTQDINVIVRQANDHIKKVSHLPLDNDAFDEHVEMLANVLTSHAVPVWEKRVLDRAAQTLITQARTVRSVVQGQFAPGDIGEFSYSNPYWSALESHAQHLPQHARALLFAHSNDPDVVLQGFILDQECDVLGASRRSRLSADVHVLSILNDVPNVTWPDRPKHWTELPTPDHVPWQLAPVAEVFLHKTVVLGDEAYNINVIKDIEELNANSAPNNMGNCTSTYASGIRQGQDLILAIGRGSRCEINVSVSRDNTADATWAITEVKGPHNVRVAPALESALRIALEALMANP